MQTATLQAMKVANPLLTFEIPSTDSPPPNGATAGPSSGLVGQRTPQLMTQLLQQGDDEDEEELEDRPALQKRGRGRPPGARGRAKSMDAMSQVSFQDVMCVGVRGRQGLGPRGKCACSVLIDVVGKAAQRPDLR